MHRRNPMIVLPGTSLGDDGAARVEKTVMVGDPAAEWTNLRLMGSAQVIRLADVPISER